MARLSIGFVLVEVLLLVVEVKECDCWTNWTDLPLRTVSSCKGEYVNTLSRNLELVQQGVVYSNDTCLKVVFDAVYNVSGISVSVDFSANGSVSYMINEVTYETEEFDAQATDTVSIVIQVDYGQAHVTNIRMRLEGFNGTSFGRPETRKGPTGFETMVMVSLGGVIVLLIALFFLFSRQIRSASDLDSELSQSGVVEIVSFAERSEDDEGGGKNAAQKNADILSTGTRKSVMTGGNKGQGAMKTVVKKPKKVKVPKNKKKPKKK